MPARMSVNNSTETQAVRVLAYEKENVCGSQPDTANAAAARFDRGRAAAGVDRTKSGVINFTCGTADEFCPRDL